MRKRILITGATGFVGIHLIRKIIKENYIITCLVKKDRRFIKGLKELKKYPVKIIYADITKINSLIKIKKHDVLIHLAAAVGVNDIIENMNVNWIGSRNMLEACRIINIRRIISFGSIAGLKKFKGIYGITKNESERIFRESGFNVAIFRPTMIYGKESKGFNKVIKSVKMFPWFIPIVGNGKHLRQPVYVEDVVDAVLASLKTKKSIGKIYNLAGAKRLTFNEFIDKICKELGIRKVKIHIPIFICKIIAAIYPLITKREILSINQDTRMNITLTKKDLGFNPIKLEDGIRRIFKY